MPKINNKYIAKYNMPRLALNTTYNKWEIIMKNYLILKR